MVLIIATIERIALNELNFPYLPLGCWQQKEEKLTLPCSAFKANALLSQDLKIMTGVQSRLLIFRLDY